MIPTLVNGFSKNVCEVLNMYASEYLIVRYENEYIGFACESFMKKIKVGRGKGTNTVAMFTIFKNIMKKALLQSDFCRELQKWKRYWLFWRIMFQVGKNK